MYIIEWQFTPKVRRYWHGFASGYSTDKENARTFPGLKAAEVEAQKIMNGWHIGASPVWKNQ